MILKKFLFLVLLIYQTAILAQSYSFSSYSVEDGLSQSQVMTIYEDQLGFIWIGTYGGGANRFDGISFEDFSELSSNIIWDIEGGTDHDIWFATNTGLVKFDGLKFKRFTTQDGLLSNVVYSLYNDSNNTLWVGTQKGLNKIINGDISKVFSADTFETISIKTITMDNKGNLWIGTLGKGVIEFMEDKIKIFDETNGLCNNNVFSIFPDSHSNYWIGTRKGLSKLSGTNIKNYYETDILPNNFITSIDGDNQDNIWISTNGGGAVKFYNGKFKYFNERNGLPTNTLWTLFPDSESNIWFGTAGEGFCKLNSENFMNFKETDGLPSQMIMSIAEDSKNNIWFGSADKGTFKYDGNKFIPYNSRKGLNSKFILNILKSSAGNLWFCSYDNGLFKYDKKSFRNYSMKEGLPSNNILCIQEENNGTYWVGSLKGLSKFNGSSFINYDVSDNSNKNIIWSILIAEKNDLWLGTNDGVFNFDGKTFSDLTKTFQLSGKKVFSIIKDYKSNIWFGTYGKGLLLYDPHKEISGNNPINISENEGLSHNGVVFLKTDYNGFLWIGTTKGLVRLNLKKYYNLNEIELKNFSKEDGFIGIECNQNAVLKDHENNIWLGTVKGVVKFNLNKNKHNSVGPKIYITNLRLFYENQNWHSFTDSLNYFGLPKNLELPFEANHLTFDFVGISKTSPKKVKYRYMLDGIDKTWSPSTKETHATYSKLSPGKYKFKVCAMNNDGLWNNTPAEYSFSIQSPIYYRWWFITLSIFSIVLAVYLLVKIRVKNLLRITDLLEKEVADRTQELRDMVANRDKFFSIIAHDLRSPFTSLLGLTEHISNYGHKLSADELEEASLHINNSAKNVVGLIENLLEWSRVQLGKLEFFPENISAGELIKQIIILFRPTANEKSLNIINNLKNENVVHADRYMIGSVFRNLISNSIKFTKQGGTIEISSADNEHFIEFYITDNGVGMDQDEIDKLFRLDIHFTKIGTSNESGTGLGLILCREFVEKNNGKIGVISELGSGTKFIVSLPKP